MKRRNKFFAALTAVAMSISSFGMLGVTAAVNGPEMVTNGGFEETSGAVVKELGNTTAVNGLEYSTNESFDGTRSIHITSAGSKATTHKLGLVAGESYNFSFYIKGELPSTNGMYIRMAEYNTSTSAAKLRWNEEDGFYLEQGSDILKVTFVEDGWYKVETTTAWVCGTYPANDTNATSMLNPQNWVNGSNVPVEPDLYIDKFSITKADGTEIITNGSFEPDSVGATITELGNTAPIAGLEYSTGVGYKDNSSIHVTKSAQLTTVSKLGLTNESKYNFSFYIKGSLPAGNGMYLRMGGWSSTQVAQIKQTNGAFCVSSSNNNLQVTEVENGWYKVETTTAWTCGNSTDASAALLFPQSNGGNPDFYIDDFSITSASASDTNDAVITQLGNTSAISGLEYSNVDAYNSINSIHVTKSAQLTTVSKLGLTNGSKYNFSFYIKGSLPAGNGMYLRMGGWSSTQVAQIKQTNGAFYVSSSNNNLQVTEAENGWYKVETTTAWTCGNSTDASAALLFPQSNGGNPNFYIDDFSITESTTGTEMVTDGGFEATVIGTEMITNGSFAGHTITDTNGAIITELGNTAAVAGVEYSTADAYKGGSSVHVTQTAEVAKTTNLGLVANKSYKFSFMIKGDLHDNGMYMRMGGWGYTSNAALLKETNGVFSVVSGQGDTILKAEAAEDGWYKIETIQPWICGSGTGTESVLLYPQKEANFYIDNLSITEVLPDTEIGTFAMTGETTEKTVTINVTNNGIADGYSAILILATHKDGVMQLVAVDDNATVVEMGETATLTQTITVNEGETLTAFLWDSLEGMEPLTTPGELITVTAE